MVSVSVVLTQYVVKDMTRIGIRSEFSERLSEELYLSGNLVVANETLTFDDTLQRSPLEMFKFCESYRSTNINLECQNVAVPLVMIKE
jgi:hypothetical protein